MFTDCWKSISKWKTQGTTTAIMVVIGALAVLALVANALLYVKYADQQARLQELELQVQRQLESSWQEYQKRAKEVEELFSDPAWQRVRDMRKEFQPRNGSNEKQGIPPSESK